MPEYTKKHKKTYAFGIKNSEQAIARSKDPEETFFEAFPSALGITLSYFTKRQIKTAELYYNIARCRKGVTDSYDEICEDDLKNSFVVNLLAKRLTLKNTRDIYKSVLKN
ncbi:MAG: hypothetical protein U5K51_02935 [Flavobacteriaceae bacterium]|nr:hypothetical protein [Flavobacteriaceae bacterium]